MAAVQGRVKLLLTPVALPGNCVICGSIGGDGRRFVDFDWQQDYYGAIYFCEICIAEVMDVLEFVKISKYNELQSENVVLKDKLDKANATINSLKETLRNVFAVDADNSNDTNSSSVDGLLSTVGKVPESESDNTDNANGSNQNSDKSSSVKEPRNLRKSSTRLSKSSGEPEPIEF